MSISERYVTYDDMLSYLTSLLDGGARTKDLRMHKEVIQGAYRDIAMGNEWQYYMTEGRVNLDASYSTGTVAYNTSTNELTLTGGTWPTWAKYGRIEIGDDLYDVSKRVSTTVLNLGTLKPTETISGGTKYTIHRSIYPLPSDMQRIYEVGIEKNNWVTYYISPTEWQKRERYFSGTGQTWAWTIMKDPHDKGVWALYVDPNPSTAEPLMFMYRRKPRVLRWSGTEAKARTCTANGSTSADPAITSVADSSGAVTMPSSMVGSIVRLAADSALPTGFSGSNPFNEQHEITAVGSGTISILGTLSQAYSGAKLLISDPIDMSDNMLEAFKAQMEYRLARFSNDQRGTVTAQKVADFELRRALEAESRVAMNSSGRMTRYDYLFTHLSNVITTSS
ncbi:MAG: hypothetical protein Unbinned1524contig1001_57 [Prokaryotic dsDNA virus sp.]|nr:MAG: hypothetical protein Unbinned1524contig1001_57 [Prokaryotic dsDNA virus sp.]|tara:strand:- start:28158 stop:29336 length:1179 start_codon:yes stop_codon:yes gene_type:complete